jgi:hypothetical protein
MVSTLCVPTTGRVPYCSVHQRVWVEALDHWMACLEPPGDEHSLTEGTCDTCMRWAFATFRAQFPEFYTSDARSSHPAVASVP